MFGQLVKWSYSLNEHPETAAKLVDKPIFYIDTAFRLQLILFTKFKLDCLVLMHHIIVNQKYKFNYAWLKRAMLCEIT